MSTRFLLLGCAIVLASSASIAQQAEAPADAASASRNCAKRHDHGAERQSPTPANECKPEPAKADKAQKKTRIRGHDHGKFHKNQ